MVLANGRYYLKETDKTGSHQTVTFYGTCLFIIHTHTHTHTHTKDIKIASIYKQIKTLNVGGASTNILKMLL